jgi:hypothetical protein
LHLQHHAMQGSLLQGVRNASQYTRNVE